MAQRSMKRILIVTQYIYPEPFKSSELAFELTKRGYKVDVLTGIPNYPEGKYYKGYGIFSKRKELVNGVTFYRCFQTPRKLLPGFIGQSINYITFVISSLLWIFFYFIWKKKYFAIIAHEPSPITQIIPACVLGRLKDVPVYSWIQDIWPDAVISAGGKVGKILSPPLSWITDWIYRHSSRLLITSKGMEPLINRNADYSHKIIYYPQWSEDMLVSSQEGINESELISTNRYNIMMIGSLNSGIGVSPLISLCEDMKNDPINFIFVGGGSEENNMRQAVKERGLTHVFFTGRKPAPEMPYFFAKANALLLSLKDTKMPHLEITVPARLQSYMSAGKPIFAMIGHGTREIITEAKCGYAVPPGQFKELANIIRRKMLLQHNECQEMGRNGRRYYEMNFTKDICIDNLCEIISLKE